MADHDKLKVAFMVLQVDLQCNRCYKKVKKVLCKFPQIRDQIYDEKSNSVIIKVVCCNPEKLREKICCKGCGVIKSIEIKDPPKPPETPSKVPERPPNLRATPRNGPAQAPVERFVPVPGYPPAYPTRVCCRQCYEGIGGGPCYQGYGRPGPCCDGCASGRPIYDSYGGRRPCEYVGGCSFM